MGMATTTTARQRRHLPQHAAPPQRLPLRAQLRYFVVLLERFRLPPDGKTLEVAVTVEDPDAFNEPLHLRQAWRKVSNPMLETVCPENNADFFHQNLYPIPEAETVDF